MSGEELKAKAREAALKLADMPVKGLRVGEKPYVVMHALDRDALVDLLAEVAHPLPEQPQGGWQPWESAPEDGTAILAYRPDAGVFTAHYVEEDAHLSNAMNPPEGDFFWFTTSGEDLTGDLPTHWMPLPSPPSTETKESGDA